LKYGENERDDEPYYIGVKSATVVLFASFDTLTLALATAMGNTESNVEPPPGAAIPPQPQFEVRLDDARPIYLSNLETTKQKAEDQGQGQEVKPSPPNESGKNTDDVILEEPSHHFGRTALKYGISDLPKACRSNADEERFHDEEVTVRKRATHNAFWLTALNGYSAVKVFVVHLISMESILSIILTVGFTVFTYYNTVRQAIEVI
jgi:hypothetical protein